MSGAPTQLKEAREIQAMFAGIHRRYDLVNRVMTGGRDLSWRRRVWRTLGLRGDERVLDLCCGTGDLALCLPRTHRGPVTGVDFVAEMLELAQAKADRAGRRLDLVAGDATALPFPAASFDVAALAFGIRNVPDLDRGLAELARVIAPGGRLAILELTPSDKPFCRWLHRHYSSKVVPLLGRLLAGKTDAYRYLPASVDRFPDRHALARRIEAAGFGEVGVVAMNWDLIALHTATRKQGATSPATLG